MKENEGRPEEYLLACRARLGDPEALSTLAERLRVPLFGLAFAELRQYDDAQDVVAATLLQICLHITELREPERMRSWTWEVARNEVRRLARKRGERGRPEIESQNFEDTATDQANVLRLDIQLALSRLPAAHAEAISLHYLLGHSINEIAERFTCAPGTVKSWLHHARHRLAREMEAYAPQMTDKPSPPVKTKEAAATPKPVALIWQSDLDSGTLTKVTNALQVGGYQVSLFSADEIIRAVSEANYEAISAWFPVSLFVLDETVAGHSALEFLVLWKSQKETRNVQICVLMNSPPDAMTAAAYFGAGAARLITKTPDETFAALVGPAEKKKKFSFLDYTEAARHVVFESQFEARRLGHDIVMPEHFLLALTAISGTEATKKLLEKLGLSLETLRREIERAATVGPGGPPGDMQLSAGSKQVLELAYEEAQTLGNDYISVEHFLLGLLRETESAAGHALKRMALEINQTRNIVREWQQNPG